jgi:hypothetical protein
MKEIMNFQSYNTFAKWPLYLLRPITVSFHKDNFHLQLVGEAKFLRRRAFHHRRGDSRQLERGGGARVGQLYGRRDRCCRHFDKDTAP